MRNPGGSYRRGFSLKREPPAFAGKDLRSLIDPGVVSSLPSVNRSSYNKKGSHDPGQSQAHTKWEYKYHIMWIPKRRQKSSLATRVAEALR